MTTLGFNLHQYTQWMMHTKELPETLARDEASRHIRDVCLALKERPRTLLLPASLMLIGGGIISASNKKSRVLADAALK